MSWQPIETAPSGKILLLFAVTDIRDDGVVKNWKMATGSRHYRHGDEPFGPWTWNGIELRVYDIQPTHWQPLPAPPEAT